jgi:glycosyltransferase involved in cell wall biosynthesis
MVSLREPLTPLASRLSSYGEEGAPGSMSGNGSSLLPDIRPENTVFAIVCFEGPDRYSNAGGLGVRTTELAAELAAIGFPTHFYFVGDPNAPADEYLHDGRLVYHRWCQWVSKYYPRGVYDGEREKLFDFASSLPHSLLEDLARPTFAAGKHLVVLSEEWHTASTACNISDALHGAGLRQHALLLWNANNTMGFEQVDFARLRFTQTLTTVSHWMKHVMWNWGCNPLVIPNGIPARWLESNGEVDWLAGSLREALGHRLLLGKVARFDPDKRWNGAVEAVAEMRRMGLSPLLVAKGGIEPHGAEVLHHAEAMGLKVHHVFADDRSAESCLRAICEASHGADVLNVRFFVPENLLRALYRAADVVLANSGREPFGLVGLEVMGSGGVAFTGATGEEYAKSFRNAIVIETEDPREVAAAAAYVRTNPALSEELRRRGRETAAEYTWGHVIEFMKLRLQFLGLAQGWTAPV